MTKREMLIKTLRREGMFGVPCDIFFSPGKAKEYQGVHPGTDYEHYFDTYHRCTSVELSAGYEGDGRTLFRESQFPGNTFPRHFTVDPYGVGMAGGSEAAHHMVHFHSPLEGEQVTVHDIIDFHLPKIPDDAVIRMRCFSDETKKAGYASAALMVQTIWERSWLIRGMNDLMMDMAMGDEKAGMLLDRMTDHACSLARLYGEAGFDIIMLGDDIGMQDTTMMSLAMWRTWLKPRLARVICTVRESNPHALVWYHSCGFIEPFIPELIEIGVDILNPLQPESMDIASIVSRYGDTLSFWGGIGTQRTLPFGRTDEVREKVLELAAMSLHRGGFVIAPTHMVEPEVPWENIEAFRAALLEARELVSRDGAATPG